MKKLADLLYIILIIIAVSFFVFLWMAGEANAACGEHDETGNKDITVHVCASVSPTFDPARDKEVPDGVIVIIEPAADPAPTEEIVAGDAK